MVQKFYIKNNKLKPQDWTEEIEIWETYYMNDKYQIEKRRTDLLYEYQQRETEERIAPLKIIWKEEEKLLLQDCDGKYCGHRRKIEMNGIIVCYDCGRELGRCIAVSVGYGFRNHVMKTRKKKQPKVATGSKNP